MILFIGYENCSTCKDVRKFLDKKNIDYKFQDVKKEKPRKEQIKKLYEKSGLDIKKFFNTSGKVYRDLNLKDKLKDMDLDEKLELLSSDGMLLKRPIIEDGDSVVIGKKNIKEYFEDKNPS